MPKVLVVDDDPDIAKVLRYMLTEAGHQVVTAYGGEDALRRLQRAPVDRIITDLAMPGMSGPVLIHRLRDDEVLGKIPIIAVTAYVWDDIGQKARAAGCDAFLSKPFTRDELLRTVQKYLPTA
jgi:CheY-like chemotaxis protein